MVVTVLLETQPNNLLAAGQAHFPPGDLVRLANLWGFPIDDLVEA